MIKTTVNESMCLIKFIAKKKYLKDFLRGSLYMNTLNYFWNEYRLSKITDGIDREKNLEEYDQGFESGQFDLYEGTASVLNKSEAEFGEAITERIKSVVVRAKGYGYCNVLSFCGVPGNDCNLDIQRLSQFGEYVIVVKNKEELLRRIGKACSNEGFSFIFGKIIYKLDKDMDKSYFFDIATMQDLDMKQLISSESLKSQKDCFYKNKRYSYQKEWRLALYRGVKATDAYRLEIGSTEDICDYYPVSELSRVLQELDWSKCGQPFESNYYGNISRAMIKDKFLALGDYKGKILARL